MLESSYQAYIHMPWIAWIPAAVLFFIILRKLPFFYGMLGALTLFIFLDGMCAGMWFHLGGADHVMFEPLALLFILLGDLRYFLIAYRYGKHHTLPEDQAGPWQMWLRLIPWTLAPTLALAIGKALLPEAFVGRNNYIVYELVMFISLLLFISVILPSWFRGREEHDLFTWLRRITYIELTHYGLWILSDVLILSGVDAGFGLRFVPDVIYYSCFIPAVYVLAPAHLKVANFRMRS